MLVTGLRVLLLAATVKQSVQVAVEACAGESVTLPCLSTSRMGVDWRYRQRPTSYGDYVVASGHVQKKFEDRFSLNRTTQHQRSLVVSRLRKNDEGLYICIEDAGLGPRHQYQLTVREGCNSRLTGDSSEEQTSSDSKNNNAAFIGAGISVFIIIVGLVVFLVRRRRRRLDRERRAAEDAEASGGDVTEELDEIRKSFSARLRSETLQRQSENLQKDSKIRKLETILESQLHRETAKDQKIAELEEKIEAVVQSNQTQNQRQTAELHKGRATLLSKGDKESDTGKGNGGKGKRNKIEYSAVQADTSHDPLETEDEPSSTNVTDEIQHFEKLEEETPGHEQRPTSRRSSRRGILSVLLKRKSSQTKIT